MGDSANPFGEPAVGPAPLAFVAETTAPAYSGALAGSIGPAAAPHRDASAAPPPSFGAPDAVGPAHGAGGGGGGGAYSLPGGVGAAKPAGGVLSVSRYASFFNVDTVDVLSRLRMACVPLGGAPLAAALAENPDLCVFACPPSLCWLTLAHAAAAAASVDTARSGWRPRWCSCAPRAGRWPPTTPSCAPNQPARPQPGRTTPPRCPSRWASSTATSRCCPSPLRRGVGAPPPPPPQVAPSQNPRNS